MAKINYEKLGWKDCVYCRTPFVRTGPADKACAVCKKHVANVTQQVYRDIKRFKKFGSYEGRGQGSSNLKGREHPQYNHSSKKNLSKKRPHKYKRQVLTDSTIYTNLISRLKNFYHISEQEFRCLSDKQKGCCDICGNSLEEPCVDHDHNKEGEEAVRGLLCRKCNTGIGMLGDDRKRVESALKYLIKHEKV